MTENKPIHWIDEQLKIGPITEAHGHDAICEYSDGTAEERVGRDPVVVWAVVTVKAVQYSGSEATGREEEPRQEIRGFIIDGGELKDPSGESNFRGYARTGATLQELDDMFVWNVPLMPRPEPTLA
jgi:hypothetical protein